MATQGPGLAATSLPGDTLTNVNRGRIRGWAGIAAVLLVVLAVISWPYLLGVGVFLAGAAGCLVFLVWIHRALPDVEEGSDEPDDTIGHRD